MSTTSTVPDSSLSDFPALFTEALDRYEQKTGTNLLADPLFAKLKDCDDAGQVLAILVDTCKSFDDLRKKKTFKCIKPMVHVLMSVTGVIGNGSTVVSACRFACFLALIYLGPAKAIFSGIGVLLQVVL
jgi:hypothetical protein